MFKDRELARLGRNFVTCLTRVPDAYSILGKYKITRPSLLILDPDDKVFGVFTISFRDPVGSLIGAKQYLKRALRAKKPLKSEGLYKVVPNLTVLLVTSKESQAFKLGIRAGDVVWSAGGKRVKSLQDLKDAVTAAKENEYKLVIRRYDFTDKGALKLARDKSGKALRDKQGLLRWAYEDISLKVKPGALGLRFRPDPVGVFVAITTPREELAGDGE